MPVTLRELESKKEQLLAHLDSWPEEKLRFQSDANNWSALQVLDHLAKTEVAIQNSMSKGFTNPHRIGLRDRVGNRFLQRVFASDRKVKVPSSVTAILPETLPVSSTVKASWSTSRDELQMLLAGPLPPSGQGVFRHPVAGWMTVDGVLAFFSVHIDHHMHQIRALDQAFQSQRVSLDSTPTPPADPASL